MNQINPPRSQFCATVNGKQTALAGCLNPCGKPCLRADDRLQYRASFPATACAAFIPNH